MSQNAPALAAKVENLEIGHAEMRKEIRIIDSKMDAGFMAIGQKIDAKTTPQWQPIGILVSVLLAIGGAIIWPIRETMTRQEAMIEAMRREGEGRIVKLWDEQRKTETDLAYLRGQLHPLPAR